MVELTVRIKGDDQTLNRKFLIYDEDVKLNYDDKILKEAVEATLKDFKSSPDSIRVKISMEW